MRVRGFVYFYYNALLISESKHSVATPLHSQFIFKIYFPISGVSVLLQLAFLSYHSVAFPSISCMCMHLKCMLWKPEDERCLHSLYWLPWKEDVWPLFI